MANGSKGKRRRGAQKAAASPGRDTRHADPAGRQGLGDEPLPARAVAGRRRARRHRPRRDPRRLPADRRDWRDRRGRRATPRPARAPRVRRRLLPDQPAAGAPRRRDADRDADHAEGRDRDQGRGRPVADRGRQLRRAGLVRLLRRDRLPPHPDPPGRNAVRHPGRRSGGDRHGRPRLHHHRRAGHDAVQARHGGDGPDAGARTASARSSSSSSTTRTGTSWARPTPTRSSATSRPGWTSPTRSSSPPAGVELPANPVPITTATVANP